MIAATKKALLLIVPLVVLFLLPQVAKAAPLDNCPIIADINNLQVGDDLTGYTVTTGETVESFDVEVLGIQKDAFLPGHSIIIAKASGAPINMAGDGIAAGMSGSPVYNSS